MNRTFDAVLLASTMLNTQTAQRRAFLATCRQHVDPQGVVVMQQSAPSWFDTVAPSEVEHDGIRRVVQSVRRDGPRVDVVVEYHVGDRMWTHAWDSYRISDRLAEAIGAVGLELTQDDLAAIERAAPPGAAAGERYDERQMAMLDSEQRRPPQA